MMRNSNQTRKEVVQFIDSTKEKHTWQMEASYVANFQLKWKDNWVKRKVKKDLCFNWTFWHATLARNTWKAKTNHDIHTTFPSCNLNILKSTKHRFQHYPRACKALESAFTSCENHHIPLVGGVLCACKTICLTNVYPNILKRSNLL